MRKPRPGIVTSVAILFLTGCFHVQVQPLPAPEARRSTEIRGVVLNGAGEGERIEFDRVDHVEWTDSTVVLTGVLEPSPTDDRETVTIRSFPLSSVSGVLVRQIDPNTTSIIIAAVGVGAIAVAALLLTGKANEDTVFGGLRY